MFHYLYYKLYQASLKSSLNDMPRFMTAVSFGGLISVNILVLSAFFAKLDIAPFSFRNPLQASVFALIIIILIYVYHSRNRIEFILTKYSQEDNNTRIIGNTVVSIYVAISFLSIFAVAFFRVGKL